MLKDNTDEHVTVNAAVAGNTAVSLRTTVNSKELVRSDKKQADLSAYVPTLEDFKVNDNGILTFVHTTSEEGIENRTQLAKIVNRKRRAYAATAIAPLVVSTAVLASTGLILDPVWMSIIVAANLPLAFITLGVTMHATIIPKKLSPTIQLFTPQFKEWLQEAYGLTVSDKTAQSIAFKMTVWSDIYRYIEFKAIDKKQRYYITHDDNRWWILQPRNGYLREVPYIGERKNEPATNPTADVNLEETSNTNIPSFMPEVAEQQTFLDKVTLLEKQALTSEEQHVMNRAKQEAQTAHNAATALKMLGSDLHTETLSEVFTLLNTELDTIINTRQETMHAQLTLSKKVIQERSSKPFTLA